jgi:hypothetical protein
LQLHHQCLPATAGPAAHSRRISSSRVGQPTPDDGERPADVVVVLGRNRKDLRLILDALGHDHQSRRSLSFDVELDAPEGGVRDVECHSTLVGDRQPPIGYDYPMGPSVCDDLDRLIRFEDSLERIDFGHADTSERALPSTGLQIRHAHCVSAAKRLPR